jgi:hypothetical protein
LFWRGGETQQGSVAVDELKSIARKARLDGMKTKRSPKGKIVREAQSLKEARTFTHVGVDG